MNSDKAQVPWRFLTEKQSTISLVDGGTAEAPPDKREEIYEEYIKKCVEHLHTKLKFEEGDVLLDIGSGTGDIAKQLSIRYESEVHCCDVNEHYLKLAKENCKELNNAYFYLVENDEFPLSFLRSNSINVAYALGVFIHNSTDILIAYLEEAKRTLVPGGVFYAQYCVDIPSPELDPHNAYRLSDREEINKKIEELELKVIINNEYPFARWDGKKKDGIKGQAIVLQT